MTHPRLEYNFAALRAERYEREAAELERQARQRADAFRIAFQARARAAKANKPKPVKNSAQ
jgi:hypothetical protein